MKTYAFIVINKANMRQLNHFATAEKAADYAFPKYGPQICDNLIFVKDEKKIVDISELRFYGALPNDVHRKLKEILEKS